MSSNMINCTNTITGGDDHLLTFVSSFFMFFSAVALYVAYKSNEEAKLAKAFLFLMLANKNEEKEEEEDEHRRGNDYDGYENDDSESEEDNEENIKA